MAPKASERGPPPRKFWVQATKKGLAPLTVEKRKFKKVTVLKNCGGDVRELLQTVKQILGVGGSVQESGGNVLGLEFQVLYAVDHTATYDLLAMDFLVLYNVE